jgi:membrane protein DedA with SNARE-associated domain
MEALTAELAQHGLRIVFTNVLLQQIGIPIPAEPTLIVAGSLASRHVLSGSAVALCALTAIVIADLAWFAIGRWFGVRVLRLVSRLLRAPESRMRETQRTFARWGFKLLLIAKFLPGLSQLLLPMAGAMGARLRTVVFYDLLGGILWTTATVGSGMFFHRQIEALLAAPPGKGFWVVASAGVATAGLLTWIWRRRHPSRSRALAWRGTSAEGARDVAGWIVVTFDRRRHRRCSPAINPRSSGRTRS